MEPKHKKTKIDAALIEQGEQYVHQQNHTTCNTCM